MVCELSRVVITTYLLCLGCRLEINARVRHDQVASLERFAMAARVEGGVVPVPRGCF